MSNDKKGTSVLVQGRIVWLVGDTPFVGEQKKDQNTKQPLFNPDGTPKISFGFGLAVPKSSLSGPNGQIFQVMQAEAGRLFPNGFPPSFAWKYKDGDGVDHEGKPFGDREGHAGHLVLALTTMIIPKFFRWDQQAGTNVQIQEGIKCGDYVNVQVNVVAHPAIGQGKPGLYLNPLAVQFLGYGTEIVNVRMNADATFGANAPALPQGATAVPTAPNQQMLVQPTQAQPQGMPGLPGQPQQFQQPAQQPVQPQGMPGMPQMGNANAMPAQPQSPQYASQNMAMPGYAQPAPGTVSNGMPQLPGMPGMR